MSYNSNYNNDWIRKMNETVEDDDENTATSKKDPEEEKKEKILSWIPYIIGAAFSIIMTIVLIAEASYYISDTQNAIVETFGNPTAVTTAGIKFKIPLIQDVVKIDMSSRGMAIGYTVEGDETISEEALMITKDFNFLEVYFYLEYQVSDPIKFYYNSENPELILSNLAQSAIRDSVGVYGVDDTLTNSRYEIEEKVKATLIASLEAADIGLKLNNATIQDVETPTPDVQAAFDRVEDSKKAAEEEINKAKTYKEEEIPKAEGIADGLLKDAEGQKTARINEANGQVARFNSLYEEYKNAPEATKLRMYYEVMEEVMPNVQVIITNSNGDIVNVFNQPTEKAAAN